MRTSFVFIIVSLFLAAVYADTDVCETTTAEVKAATRILNTWRAACEDHGWKGATCYNYWAQLNEVMTLENNLQTCLTGIFQQQKELMLGTSTEAGLYSADAAATRDVDNTADAATKKLVVDEQTGTRDHVTSTINNVIQTTVSDLRQQSNDTRATVSAQFTSTKNAVKADNTDARSAENTSAKNIKDRVVAQETETRTFVDSAHDLTRSQISNAASVDGTSSRTNNNKQEASTRATMLVEATNTQSVVNAQAQQTQQLDLAQEKQTRGNTVSEHTTSRSTVDAEHTSTRQTVVDAAADEKNAVNQAETANRQAVNDDAAASLNFVSASAGSARSLFSGLQTALVSSLLSEQSTMSDDMWGPFVRILVHYDLQGKACDKFGDTFTFATLSSAGAGRFEQLRGEANETMVFNEKMYGTNRVGYARYYWNNAESYLNNKNYRSAAEQYRLCYNEATQPH